MFEGFITLFGIRRPEAPRAMLLFSHIFLLIASLLVVKPVSNALFIQNIGIQKLPLALILVAVFSGLLMAFYTHFSRQIKLVKLISGTLLICILVFSGFRLLFGFNLSASFHFYAFYIWVSIYGVLTASQFWLMVNAVLNAREAKRLFGFIGSGAISGGIVGGYLASYLADTLGTSNLLFVTNFFLLCCTGISLIVLRNRTGGSGAWSDKERRREKSLIERPIRAIFKSPHLSLTAGIVTLSVLVATLADFQFRYIASEALSNADTLTSFFGFWQSTLSIIALLIQLFLTSRVINALGVNTALYILPAGLLLGTVAIIFSPALWSAVLLKVTDGSFKQSFHKAGVELLFFPIPYQLKKSIKGFIDVFLDNLATGIAGILLIILTGIFHWTVPGIGLVMLLLIAAWLLLVFFVRATYVQSFREAIENRTLDLEDPAAGYKAGELIAYLDTAVERKNRRQVTYLLDMIGVSRHPDMIKTVRKMLLFPFGEVQLRALRIAQQLKTSDFTGEAENLLIEGAQDIRMEAMYYLYLVSGESQSFLDNYKNAKDSTQRWSALMCAARKCRLDKAFREKMREQAFFTETENPLINDKTPPEEVRFIKIQAARVIGTAKISALYPRLENLLADPDSRVILQSLISTGETEDARFGPLLLPHLTHRRTKRPAREALANLGDKVLELLDSSLGSGIVNTKIRQGIPRVLSYIPTQISVDILARYLNTAHWRLYSEVLRSLARIKTNEPDLKFDKNFFTGQIIQNTRIYYALLTISRILYQEKKGREWIAKTDARAAGLLQKALEERKSRILERIFRLLGLIANPKDIWNAYKGIVSNKVRLKANAMEYLDNVLSPETRRRLMPLIEFDSMALKAGKYPDLYGNNITSAKMGIIHMMNGEDSWLKICAIYAVSRNRKRDPELSFEHLIDDKNPLVRETVAAALNKKE